MFAGDDFKMSANASSALGKPADSVCSDTALGRSVIPATGHAPGLQRQALYELKLAEPDVAFRLFAPQRVDLDSVTGWDSQP